MALFDLNRSNDTPITTLKVSEIAPKNWHRFPNAVTGAMLADANPNDTKPRYNSMTDWAGGVSFGEDPGLPVVGIVAQSKTATVALARSGGGANEPDYVPRTQYAKRTQLSADGAAQRLDAGVVDVGRNRGSVAPGQRYPVAGDAALAAPVVSSIAPNTAVHGAQPLICVVTGTGFTPGSLVITGGSGSPWDLSSEYISPTQMRFLIDPRASVAGTISVAVVDHSVLSNTNVVFTIT
jgi:hypothetical protein